MKYFKSGVVLSTLSLVIASSAHANITDKVEKTAAEIAEIRGYLEGSDENKAVAAMTLFLESENPVIRQMAIDYGLNHSKSYIRAATLEKVLRASRTLQFEYQYSDSFTQAQRDMYSETGAVRALSTRITGNGDYQGYFRGEGNSASSTTITINGTAMHLHANRCGGRFSLEGVHLTGYLACSDVSMPVRVQLY